MADRRGELASAQLESLQRITAIFATAFTSGQIIDELVRHATQSMNARVWVVLCDESGQGLDTVAGGGLRPRRCRASRADSGECGLAAG